VRGSSPAPVIAVIEVGGTALRAARFESESSSLVNRRQGVSPNYLVDESAPEALIARLLDDAAELADEALGGEAPELVSIAYPGPIDGRGFALRSPTLTGPLGAQPYPLAQICAARWPLATVTVANDLTAAGYRYVELGRREFCVLTVGSGIGHKLFFDGRPMLGKQSRGGEIGHLRLDCSRDALVCDCGGRGHLGAIASGRGTVELARQMARGDPRGFRACTLAKSAGTAGGIDSRLLADAFVDGDAWTSAVVRRAASFLGQGLAAIHLIAGTEEFILLGGFARALGEAYRRIVAEAAAAASWDLGERWDEMIELGVGDDDGLIGAGVLAMKAFRRQ
jgi:C7-cyclitol 7-kinase